MQDEKSRLPVVYIPHGGGPWNVMEDAFGKNSGYKELRKYLVELGARYREKIKSILLISAHWEEKTVAVHFGSNPGMFYDYYGFPEETYLIKWPAPGNPQLAERIQELLSKAGIVTQKETERGYDHGAFVPMMVAFPEANIPVAQISLVKGLAPDTHIKIGKALSALREEGVLIIGSGMSYHNLQGLLTRAPHVHETSRVFDQWLADTVILQSVDRESRLINWINAPAALSCHPRSEHLVPLFVIAGAALEDAGRVDFSGELMNARISAHLFG